MADIKTPVRAGAWRRLLPPALLSLPGVSILLAHSARALDFLGGIDTACSAFGLAETWCGSSHVIGFLVDPPAWFLMFAVFMALAGFYWGERLREKPYLNAIAALSAEVGKMRAETKAGINDIASRVDRLKTELDSLTFRTTGEGANAQQIGVRNQLKELHERVKALESRITNEIGNVGK